MGTKQSLALGMPGSRSVPERGYLASDINLNVSHITIKYLAHTYVYDHTFPIYLIVLDRNSRSA